MPSSRDDRADVPPEVVDPALAPGAEARPGRSVTEIRFFLPGDGPTLAEARHRRRRDRYYLPELTAERSFKLRGSGGKGELKVLTGRGPMLEVADGVTGPLERWSKFSVHLATTPDGWMELAKEIHRAGPLEVTSIRSDLGSWWTVAVQVRKSGRPPLPDVVANHLSDHRVDLRCCSYAAWLVELLSPEASP